MNNEIKINISINNDFKKLISKLDTWSIKQVINKWIRRTTLFLEWESTKRTPIDTWLLRSSQRSFFSTLKWTIRNSRFYWLFVHEWTKYMKWRPWMKQTILENEKEINTEFNKWIEQYFTSLTK